MPLRRYGPALIVAAALLLVVAVAPSRGVQGGGAQQFAPFEAATPAAAGGVTGTGGAAPGAPGTGSVRAGGSGATGGGTDGGSGGAATTGGSSGSGGAGTTAPAGAATGDTGHCVDGKQFALPHFVAAPPCQPRWTGSDNGGATYKGVTSKQITVAYYRVKDNPAVEAALGSTGVRATQQQVSDYLAVEQSFINKRYELWGRKVKLVLFQSQSCQGSPPSDDCFRQDARALIAQYHPFAVVFPQNFSGPGFQDELAKLGVVNFGGLGLPGSFNTSRRPYRYDYTMDGDTQAVLAGEFYCKQLANRPASFAGDATLRTAARKAEILVPDSPETVEPAQRLQSLINSCDHGGGAVIKTYAQDTSQAASQTTTLASQAKQNGITTLIYFTDPVLPIYLTPQLTAQSYYPENVTVGSNYLDYDTFGQLYDQRQWVNAFGLGDLPQSQPPAQQDASAAWHDGGGQGAPFASADGIQAYFSVLAAGLQQAGPQLDPGTFERGVLTLPAYGGDPLHSLVKFGAGDYTGVSDVRVTYWDANATSPVNGKQGAYAPLDGGRRFGVGQFPRTALSIPGRSS
jgi:hypothetical protein